MWKNCRRLKSLYWNHGVRMLCVQVPPYCALSRFLFRNLILKESKVGHNRRT